MVNSLGGEAKAREKYEKVAKAWNEGDLPEDLRSEYCYDNFSYFQC